MGGLAAVLQKEGPPSARRVLHAVFGAMRQPEMREPRVASTESRVALGVAPADASLGALRAATPAELESQGIFAVAWGRIDNRRDVAEALGEPLRGAEPRNDAELAARAYAAWGEACAARWRGDFAIVLWDARRDRLVAIRDPIGVEPLYYRDGATALAIANDAASLGEAGPPLALDWSTAAAFLAERSTERERTLYAGVRALPPGHLLIADRDRTRISPYFKPNLRRSSGGGSVEMHAKRVRAALDAAVRDRLFGVDRAAVLLSGGFDSSSIVGALGALVRDDPTIAAPVLIRATFPGLPCDEAAFSDAVAQHWGFPLRSIAMPGDVAAYAPERSGSPAGVPFTPFVRMLEALFGAARDAGTPVVLTGHGADLLQYRTGFEVVDALWRGDFAAAWRLTDIALPLARSANAGSGSWRRLRSDLVRAIPRAARDRIRALRGRQFMGFPSWLTPAAARAAADVAEAEAPPDVAMPSRTAAFLWRELLGGTDTTYGTAADALIARACGVTLRSPFCDLRVIDAFLEAPDEWRAGIAQHKPLLRRAMGSDLPPAVRDRAGFAEFSSFLDAALVGPHAEAWIPWIEDGRLAALGLIEPRKAAATLRAARRDYALLREVVTLTALEALLRRMLA